ncbi:MAG TPA: CBS domain-containing protein [Candidatus Desulfaltia sp.]|nr:CBS domain-containing protein [Candidatus Desulfaltia sp.]
MRPQASALKVKDLMTPSVVSISPVESVEDAARVMTRFGISSVIVSGSGNVDGILTERDVLQRVVASGRDPKITAVEEVMTRSVISADPEMSLEEAGQIMLNKRIKKLPVIHPRDGGKVLGILSLTDIASLQPEIMRNYAKNSWELNAPPDVEKLINLDEGPHLEFKASLRYNTRGKCVDQELEANCLKTLCAFMNADGGELVIGVCDDRAVVGLDHDYRTLPKPNRDGFENYIINQISNKIGDLYLRYVRFRFYEVDGMEVCRVTVQSSQEPAFMSHKGKQHFYVRTGNGSRPFEISDATKYMIDRWPDILA